MKRRKEFFRRPWWLIMSLGLLMTLPQISRAQLGTWERIELEGGGVAEDQQLLSHEDEDDAENVLWSACMIWNEI